MTQTSSDAKTRPAFLYLAATASFPGYWGSSDDTAHHAIAAACSEGADRDGLFVVYDAYEGCSFSGMGGMTYLLDHGKPEINGIYDAAGNLLGMDWEQAKENVKIGEWTQRDCALSEKALKQLRDWKPSE